MYKGKNGIANKVIKEMEGGNTPEISQVTKPQTIVWVNGSFDVLHAGHIELFKYARSVGDRLVVGTDSDERIRELKGPTRPINKQKHRLSMLNAIKYIDEVVTFGSLEEQLLRMEESGAKTLVIGSDYRGKPVVGKDRMEVIFFDRIDDLSTTNIVSN
jgi:D-glycero-beta-D-manno-heptose 1-phosphate adenylyltransferase